MSATRTTKLTALLTTILGRAPSAGEVTVGLNDALLMSKVQNNLNIGLNSLTIDNTSSLSSVLSDLSTDGGGYLNLLPGTYSIAANVTIPSNVQIIGAGPANTIISCSGSVGLITAATSVYTTGTITAASGVNITGSGTLWLANVTAGQSLFLGTRFYTIAAVTGNTTLVLAESYGDNVTLSSSYRIGTITHDVAIKNLGIQNSTGTGVAFADTRKILLDNVQFILNNVGLSLTNCSEAAAQFVTAAASTSDGIQATNMGLCDWRSVNSNGNGGHGFKFNNVKTMSLLPGDCEANTGDGMNLTTCSLMDILVEANANGGQGIELVSGCDSIGFFGTIATNNTSDGIKFTATALNCSVMNGDIKSNGGWGINIANSNCTNNIIGGNYFASNSSGALTNSGTTTLTRSNIGQADSQVGLSSFVLFDHFADSGNTHTNGTVDDLYSDTLVASQLANNGEKIEAEYGGAFVSSGTATREVQVYFAGTSIFDTGTLTLSLSAAWTCYVTLIRVDASTVRYMVSFTTEGAALAAYTAVGSLGGLTLSNTNILKITGQANGVGAAANDVLAKLGSVSWAKAA